VLAQAGQAVADADGISCEVLDLRSLMPWDVQVRRLLLHFLGFRVSRGSIWMAVPGTCLSQPVDS
jgi:hypothetical protein